VVVGGGGGMQPILVTAIALQQSLVNFCVSEVQPKCNEPMDYIVLIRNSLHKKSAIPPSPMAEKYVCFGKGQIMEDFLSEGITYSEEDIYVCKNTTDLEENKDPLKIKEREMSERREKIRKKRKADSSMAGPSRKKPRTSHGLTEVEREKNKSQSSFSSDDVETDISVGTDEQTDCAGTETDEENRHIFNMKALAKKTTNFLDETVSDNGVYAYSRAGKASSSRSNPQKEAKKRKENARLNKSKRLSKNQLTDRLKTNKENSGRKKGGKGGRKKGGKGKKK
jgi:hypothetical protein